MPENCHIATEHQWPIWEISENPEIDLEII